MIAQLSLTLVEVFADILPEVWAFALRLSGDPSAATRLIESAWSRVLDGACASKLFTSPLTAIFNSVYLDWTGAHKRPNELEIPLAETKNVSPQPVGQTPLDPVGATLDDVVTAVCTLSEFQRILVVCVELHGLTHSESAEVLGVSVDKILRELASARQAIGFHVCAAARAKGISPARAS